MEITVDISLYPLDQDYKSKIKDFILELRTHAGIQLITNQMSTQVRGEFDAVMSAVNSCMKQSMAAGKRSVFITKCINAGLDIDKAPGIGPDA